MAERITNRKSGKWFKILVDEKYQFNRDVQQATEAEIREAGLDWEVVHTAFCWKNLEPDFIREIIESNPTLCKKQLERELICDIHGYSVHASAFYQNMYIYLNLGLAEQKQLVYYVDKIYEMYREQAEQEYEARKNNIVRLVDSTGRVIDQMIY